MTLRARLLRLERRAPRKADWPEEMDLFARIEAHAAYMSGKGPRPPDRPCPPWFDPVEWASAAPAAGAGGGLSCPPWIDPVEWASRKRISRCSEDRLAGFLRPDEHLPDMYEDERKYVDGLAEAFAIFVRSQPPPADALAEGGSP